MATGIAASNRSVAWRAAGDAPWPSPCGAISRRAVVKVEMFDDCGEVVD
jgi:hypothetical protein